MNGYSAIALQVSESAWWVLFSEDCPETLDPGDPGFPEIRPGFKGHEAKGDGPPPIQVREAEGDGMVVRLLETRRYGWAVPGATDAAVESSLESLQARWRTHRVGGQLSGSFLVLNYLGMADFSVRDGEAGKRFELEIASAKLDYETEFRRITEDIAEFCRQLLLSWNAPTSLGFEADAEQPARIRLEQFLFLRSALSGDRLGELLESIFRRPHSRLVGEREWTPVSRAASSDWLSDPVSMARDWRAQDSGAARIPGQVLDVRKEDTADTAPNRFVKFALLGFQSLCRHVEEEHAEAVSLARDARDLSRRLDAALALPFFRGIGPMRRLPLDNPTLQKRHGYREILSTWLLSEAAAALVWDRDEDCYRGPTRNAATLYEYWVFLQLHEILDGIEGVRRDEDNPKPSEDAEPFLQTNGGEIRISLKRGRKTCAPFTADLPGAGRLRLHLYYEREFRWSGDATAPDSYSRSFKPDYTLALFPESFSRESEAAEAGKVAYLHFDAKYRADDLPSVFGEKDEDLDGEKLRAKTTSSYKRGDLLKMHTYNDAVRRTVGSYVLYPGNDRGEKMHKFHEILPGVGAFVLKPGDGGGRAALGKFIRDVLLHQAAQFTQYRYLADVEHAVVREEPLAAPGGTIYRPSAACVLVYLPRELREPARKHRLAYARALRDDEARTPVRLRLGDTAGAVLCPYEGGRTGVRTSLPWLAPILSCEMLSREALRRELAKHGWPADQTPASAAAYLLFRLGDPTASEPRNVTALTPRGAYHAESCLLEDFFGCGEMK